MPPPPENLPFATSQNRMMVTIFNDKYSNDDGTEVELLPTIREDAKRIQDLLKTHFGYEVPSDDPTIFAPGKLENQPNLVKTFEVFLKKWKRKQPKGKTIDRFVLYYHGHGVQVLGHPCLLTTEWKPAPLAQLINLVAEYVNPNLYYLVNDCCANNKEYKDEETLKLVRTATEEVMAENFNDKLVWIKAAPPGHTADGKEGKTFTASLVDLLEESQFGGIPLKLLQERLREKQKRQGSKNLPNVDPGSFELANVCFPF